MPAESKVAVKNNYGQILGFIETHSNGDKVVKDNYGRILGTYSASQDLTKDVYGRVVTHGDFAPILLNPKIH